MAEFPNAVKSWASLIDWPDPSASRASSSDINSVYDEVTAIESILLSDTDTLNSSTDAHGLLPKLDGNSTSLLNGNGEWATGYVPVDLINDIPHKQMYAPAGAIKPTLTSGCADSARIEMGTNKNVYDYLAFDKDAIEYAYANVAMPQDYTGGVVYAQFYWTHPSTTTNYKVSWGIDAVSFSDDDTLDAAQGTTVYANDTGGATSDLYISPQTAAVTIAGTPAAGDLVNFRISRKADDATNDTLAVDAYLLGVMIWYPVS